MKNNYELLNEMYRDIQIYQDRGQCFSPSTDNTCRENEFGKIKFLKRFIVEAPVRIYPLSSPLPFVLHRIDTLRGTHIVPRYCRATITDIYF